MGADRVTVLIILALLVVTMGVVTVQAQSDPGVNLYDQPRQVKLGRAVWRNFRDYRRLRPGEAFVTESFYPIGWSKDGKFAYYLEPVDEACGCYFAELNIVDLKTDKVLWSFDYNSEFIDDAKQEGRHYSLETVWRANQATFSEKLREHDIEAHDHRALLSFPIRYKGDRLTAHLRTREQPGLTDDERLYGIIGRAKLQLRSARKGRKTVSDHSYEKMRPLHVGLVDYLKSPFEPRVAIVLVEVIRGYEGPPHTGRVRIVGADLNSGFRH